MHSDTPPRFAVHSVVPYSGGSRGNRGPVPPSRSKIIKIHGLTIGSHTCNATFDSTSGLALQKLSL